MKQEELLISVIIPAYNSDKTIARCVNSILGQTYKNFELIIVDDGSNDYTESICRELTKKDVRVFYYKKINGGVSSARNYGIKMAKGKYVCFVDSDDYVKDSYLSILARNSSEDVMPICGIKNITKLRSYCYRFKNELIDCNYFSSIKLLSKTNLINSPTNKLYKKENIIAPFDESINIGEDFLFNLLYLRRIKYIKSVKKCPYVYDRTNESLTRHVGKDVFDQRIRFYKELHSICSASYSDYDLNFVKKDFLYVFQDASFRLMDLGKGQLEDCFMNIVENPDYVDLVKLFGLEDIYLNPNELYSHYLQIYKKKQRSIKTRIKKFIGRFF